MPRRPRLQIAGGLYHVTGRGNRRSLIFHDDLDRREFLKIYAQATAFYGLRTLALCLMGNHYHGLLETPEPNLSEALQFLNGVYAQHSNRRHRQTGHLFEARFGAQVVQRETYLIRAARYVVRNPVEAHVTADAASWPWSTYRATAGLEAPPDWLNVDWIGWAFKTHDVEEARRRYVDYVNEPTSTRNTIATSGIVLGSRSFARAILGDQKRQRPELELPINARILDRPSLGTLFEPAPASGPDRDRLVHVARVDHGYRFSQIADHLGIDRTTASKAALRHRRRSTCLEPDAA
jgi:REP element-mobilizing transposase RayT